jgi:hypothetical protein
MWALLATAYGQSVPFGDFEAMTGWEDLSETCYDSLLSPPFCYDYPSSVYVASPARGTAALTLQEADWEPANDLYEYVSVRSEPFVVTRDRLSWAQTPPNTGWVSVGPYAAPVAGPASADAFTNWEIDVSTSCGTETRVLLELGYYEPDTTYDDVALTGSVCPQFLDGDGDGLCARGADLDGNGDCADAAELAAGADCDDADPLVQSCADLRFYRWVRAEATRPFEVTGMPPGEEVWLVMGQAVGSSCPASLGGRCVDLDEPVTVLGSAIADATGAVTIRATLPDAVPYEPWQFQATSTTTRTDRVEGWMLAANDRYVAANDLQPYNGSFELPEVRNPSIGQWLTAGWPQRSMYVPLGPYTHSTCDRAYTVTTPARETGALAVGTADPWEVWDCDGSTEGWPFLVTRRELRWATVGDLDVAVTRLEDRTPLVPAVAGPVPRPDGFDAWRADLTDACGEQVWLTLSHEQAGAVGHAYVDSITQVGPPCPEFLDDDGDGRCALGVDRNGDGDCLSLREVVLPAPPELPVERVLADFEVDPTPSSFLLTDADLAPLHSRGGRSAWVDQFEEWWYVTDVVTHEQLVLWAAPRGLGDWRGAKLTVSLDSDSGSVYGDPTELAGPGDWRQHATDVSAVCGRPFSTVRLTSEYSDWVGYPYTVSLDQILVDDLGFAGAPCPTFVDTDGDALCREGLDLDGDGLCVSAGEPTPDVLQDPSE